MVLPVAAQDQLHLELQELQDEIDIQSKELTEIAAREARSREEQKIVEGAIKKLRLEREKLDGEIKSLGQQSTKVALEVESLGREIQRHEKFSFARMRAVYMNGGFAPSHVLASAESLDVAALTGFYLGRVRDADVRRIETLATLKKERARQIEELNRVTAVQSSKRDEVKGKEEEQKKALNRLRDLMQQLVREKAELESSVLALQARSLRLETVVASVAEGAMVPQPVREAVEKQEEPPTLPDRFVGRGLAAFRGILPIPVEGRLARGFGKYRPSEAREVVLHKGLEYEVKKGSEIRAVAAGRVMFVGKMPAYGGLIILDHGDRYYSLYGFLRDVRVKAGDTVDGGKVLALSDDSERFYFEIRKNGSPIDPAPYLARG